MNRELIGSNLFHRVYIAFLVERWRGNSQRTTGMCFMNGIKEGFYLDDSLRYVMKIML